jgi:hypothetical protein
VFKNYDAPGSLVPLSFLPLSFLLLQGRSLLKCALQFLPPTAAVSCFNQKDNFNA